MQWFQKFMMGRYGADPLNLAIILLSLVISIAFSFTPVAWIGSILCTILLILAIFRMFSRNTGKRAAENRVFMKFWNPVKNWFQYLWLPRLPRACFSSKITENGQKTDTSALKLKIRKGKGVFDACTR